MRTPLLLLLSAVSVFGQSNVFTEFYVNHTGSNVYAGSTESGTPAFSFFSGDWSTVTSGFTAAGQDLSGLTTNMWASVYIDGATTAVFVGRITNIDNATKIISISQTIKSGTPPVTGTGTRTIRVGGAWYGPLGTSFHPFNFVQNTMTNSSSFQPRVNFKNDAVYINTNATTLTQTGPIVWEGYTTTPGDFGKAFFSQTNTGLNLVLFQITGANQTVASFVISNISTAAQGNFDVNGANEILMRCTSIGSGAAGFSVNSSHSYFLECDAHSGRSAAGNTAGFYVNSAGCVLTRCISYSNSFANLTYYGFILAANDVAVENCIATKNGGDGFLLSNTSERLLNCDSYSNNANGLRVTTAATGQLIVQNCNFINNKLSGITNQVAFLYNGVVLNCGFGSGSMTNNSGNYTGVKTGIMELGTVTYPSGLTPWNDPNNQDFRITYSGAKGAGMGTFNDTVNVGFFDIGAVQSVPAVESSLVFQ